MPRDNAVFDGNDIDNHIDDEIAEYLMSDTPKSFFLFAGAGSGKTRSLVTVLKKIIPSEKGKRLRLRSQKIAVITYTNAACDEIKSRIQYDPLIHVSTIHSFIWNLIRVFSSDIKIWLTDKLNNEIAKLGETFHGQGTKSEQKRLEKIKIKQERLKYLNGVKQFTYNPNSDNSERDALNHAEVLQLGAYFLAKKSLIQKILIRKFPILLIDESQDTNKDLMEAFFAVQTAHKNTFILGLLGDTMQQIYMDGKTKLDKNLPDDWAKPQKEMNHRSRGRIIDLINAIRSGSDTQKQRGRTDKPGGFVRFFIIPANKEKSAVERKIQQKMAQITEDSDWNNKNSVKSMILEHHMAANRMGFLPMFAPLNKIDKFKTGLRDGTLSEITIFSKIIWPIIKASEANDKFTIAKIVKKNSPSFKKDYIKKHRTEAKEILAKAKNGIESLCAAYTNNPKLNFLEILKIVDEHSLFNIPEIYRPILMQPVEKQQDISQSDIIDNDITIFLGTEFSQIEHYAEYVDGKSPFATHHGVKGLEFTRVMAIIDDSEARRPLSSYDKLFGIKGKTDTDVKNEKEGKETGINRTRRLFYVICSRAKESLAIAAYTDKPEILKASLVSKKWFFNDEIIILN